MSVHATDLAGYLIDGLPDWVDARRMIYTSAEAATFMVNVGDGKGPFLVTVADVGWDGLAAIDAEEL